MESSFGQYRIEELLGRGGMGEVYRAHDTETDRRVALKVLPVHLAQDTEYQERFRRECRAAARLREPHVVPIHRFGEIDGRLYLDMRLVEGMDLASWLAAHGAMRPAAAVSVISQVAAALDAAHAEGLVHRDVKPSNVLLAGVTGSDVDRDVFAYLFDFGIARAQDGAGADPDLTRAGTMPGSVAYIAPERFAGVEGDPRADVYSLACVLHQTLTGRPPFEGDLATLMNAHLNAPPPRPTSTVPDLPAGLDQVVAHGMAKDPHHRTATAGALAAAARGEIGGWRTDPDATDTTVAYGGGTPGGTAVIPPAWNPGQSWTPPAHGQPAYGQAPYGQTPYGQQAAYPPPPYGAPAWGAQQARAGDPHPAPRRRNRAVIVAVVVLAALVMIGGGVALAVTLGNGNTGPIAAPPSSSVTQVPPSAADPTTPTSAPSSAETDLLLAELPAGYDASVCTPDTLDGTTAFVTCPTPPNTGVGPSAATFARYASQAEMDAAFTSLADVNGIPADAGTIEECATAASVRASYTRNTSDFGGKLACYTEADTGISHLIWTDDAALAIAYVSEASGDAGALYTWWQSVDFVAER